MENNRTKELADSFDAERIAAKGLPEALKIIAELRAELLAAENTAHQGYAEAYQLITDLRQRLEDQKEEAQKQLEEGYEEAYQMLQAEKKKNETLEVEIYNEFENKLRDIKDHIITKLDEYLNQRWAEMNRAGETEMAEKLLAWRKMITPAEMLEEAVLRHPLVPLLVLGLHHLSGGVQHRPGLLAGGERNDVLAQRLDGHLLGECGVVPPVQGHVDDPAVGDKLKTNVWGTSSDAEELKSQNKIMEAKIIRFRLENRKLTDRATKAERELAELRAKIGIPPEPIMEDVFKGGLLKKYTKEQLEEGAKYYGTLTFKGEITPPD